MIEVKNLSFEYPGARALDDVSFAVDKGEIAALVGPNGAGKTTLLKCLAALDTPVSGSIEIGNIDVLIHPRRAHRKVGYLPDFFGLYHPLSVRQGLLYMARAHGIGKNEEDRAVVKAAGRLHLDDRLDRKIGTLSRGLSQRFAIAQSIVHEPDVLVLDEPASGLDPEARKALSDLFLELKAQGMTLIVSSHILAELEEYSSSMIIIRNGKIIEHKRVGKNAEDKVRISIETTVTNSELEAQLLQLGDITDIVTRSTNTSFLFSGDKDAQHRLLKKLMERNLPICGFKEEKINLQEAYLQQVENIKADSK